LAQTQLFEQIPELKKDIDVPIYCYLGENLIINAWFGPKNTVSPAHTDPYHNLLTQVVGSKYIRLYDPKYSECLYSHGEGGSQKMLTNTSQVDVEHPDLKKYPLFKSAKCQECILESGEMLFIPIKWWHYVKSLERSFSVSFWF